MSLTKKFAFYIASLLLSLFLAIFIVEIGLSLVSFSNGLGAGKASKRWFDENWKPINKFGYRDHEIEKNGTKRAIVFLGDSFTAGYGVKFTETFYFQASRIGGEKYQYANLGQSGSSTIGQGKSLDFFLKTYEGNVELVIHQYFGNDIEDYIKPIANSARSPLRQFLIEKSELANLIDSYLFLKSSSDQYLRSLFSAYSEGAALDAHLADLKRLHGRVHALDAKVFFLIFPFLNDDQVLSQSEKYVLPLKKYFLENCKKNDVMLDVSPLALKLTPGERTVNALDAHPSALLHSLIAEKIGAYLIGKNPPADSFISCPH